ncbi:MAG: CrcB family protein [Nitrososphaerota archaeon]|nr:CrcB family protein [Nitrososphaerota archaeon]
MKVRYDLLYVAAGAVIGATMRYAITSRNIYWGSLPLSVLTVNVVGSLILGVTMAAVQRLGVGSGFVLFMGIGFCGSFTTMSSLAFETANLMDAGMFITTMADVGLNMGVSVLVIFLGRAVVNMLIGGA